MPFPTVPSCWMATFKNQIAKSKKRPVPSQNMFLQTHSLYKPRPTGSLKEAAGRQHRVRHPPASIQVRAGCVGVVGGEHLHRERGN